MISPRKAKTWLDDPTVKELIDLQRTSQAIKIALRRIHDDRIQEQDIDEVTTKLTNMTLIISRFERQRQNAPNISFDPLVLTIIDKSISQLQTFHVELDTLRRDIH